MLGTQNLNQIWLRRFWVGTFPYRFQFWFPNLRNWSVLIPVLVSASSTGYLELLFPISHFILGTVDSLVLEKESFRNKFFLEIHEFCYNWNQHMNSAVDYFCSSCSSSLCMIHNNCNVMHADTCRYPTLSLFRWGSLLISLSSCLWWWFVTFIKWTIVVFFFYDSCVKNCIRHFSLQWDITEEDVKRHRWRLQRML